MGAFLDQTPPISTLEELLALLMTPVEHLGLTPIIYCREILTAWYLQGRRLAAEIVEYFGK
jgi:hypothetical protein